MAIIKKVTLNNKSRKGEYYYLKEKGKAGRYYKQKPKHYKGKKTTYKQAIKLSYDEKTPIKNILKGLKEAQKTIKEKNKVINAQEKYIKELEKQLRKKSKQEQTTTTKKKKTLTKKTKKNLNSIIKKGIYERDIELNKLTNNTIKLIKQDIANKMTRNTKDKKLLLNNFNKTKTRLQYEVTLKNENGEVLKTAFKVGTTIEELKTELNKLKLYNKKVGDEDDYRKNENYVSGFEKLNYNTYTKKMGDITKNVTVKIKYVKG